jgi:hypothetical protein
MSGATDALDALAGLVADRLAIRPDLPRLALTKVEAAQVIGVSVDHLDRHVLPDLRMIRSGRLVLIPIRELERWCDEHAACPLGLVA